MKYYIFDHMKKSRAYNNALHDAGFENVNNIEEAKIIFIDADIPNRISNLEKFVKNGALLFVYPHSAMPQMFWDFPKYAPSQYTKGTFVHSFGHEQVLRAYGYTGNIHVTGWTYSDIQLLEKPEIIKKILFAPYHPNVNSGYLSKYYVQANKEAFSRLLQYCRANNIELSCRFIGELYQNGLQPEDDVFYIAGRTDMSYQDIDESDLVVASHTYGYLSAARGKPTIFYGQEIPIHISKKTEYNEQIVFMPSWTKVKGLIKYPFDLFESRDINCLIEKLYSSDDIILKWREKMIGESFDSQKFVNIVKGYLS